MMFSESIWDVVRWKPFFFFAIGGRLPPNIPKFDWTNKIQYNADASCKLAVEPRSTVRIKKGNPYSKAHCSNVNQFEYFCVAYK